MKVGFSLQISFKDKVSPWRVKTFNGGKGLSVGNFAKAELLAVKRRAIKSITENFIIQKI